MSASGQLTFNIGETTKTIAIQSGGWGWLYSLDPSDEAYRRIDIADLRINLTLRSGDAEPASTFATIQLAGSPTSTLRPEANTVTIDPAVTVLEGRRVVIAATLATTPAPGISPSVLVGTIPDTATRDVDYRPGGGTIRWPTGTRTLRRIFAVQTLPRTGQQGDRRFYIQFSRPLQCSFAAGGTSVRVPITITDQAGQQVILTASNRVVDQPAEGTRRNITVPVTLSGATRAGVAYRVSYATQEVSAFSPRDYEGTSGTMVFRPTYNGEPVTFAVPITLFGGPEITNPQGVIYFDLFIGEGYAGGTQSPPGITRQQDSYRVTIRPRTTTGPTRPALPDVNVTNTTVGESAGSVLLRLRLSAPAPANCQVNFATANGTGRANVDYVPASGTVRFVQGQSSGTLRVNVLPNPATSDRRFRVLLSGYQNCRSGNSRTIQITVRNEDVVRPDPQPEAAPTITIADSSLEVPASGTGQGAFTISTSRALTEAISGTLTTRPGTATAGTHFNALTNQAWTIRAGQTFVNVPVTIRAATLTADLRFSATIALTTTNATISDGTANFDITQMAEPATIQVRDLNLADAATTRASVVVTRTGNLEPISFRVSTVDPPGTTLAGIRYRPITGRLIRMVQGARAATIAIDIIRPTGRVSSATFILRAGSPSPGLTIGRSDGRITLPAYEPVVRTLPFVEMGSGSQTEPVAGATTLMNFTIRLSRAWTSRVEGRFYTANITATARRPGQTSGGDYQSVNTGWSIPVGQTSTVVRVPIYADTQNEVNETFRANLTISSGNARFRTGRGILTATGTIRNRAQATSTISVGDITAVERGGNVQVPVTRTGSTSQSIQFEASTYSTGSATAGQDYDGLNNRRGIFSAGRSAGSITVPTHLRGAQPRETFGLRIHSPSTGVTIARDRGIVTLPATDPPPLFVGAPILGVEFTGDAFSSYGTLTVVYPVIIGWPVDVAVTGNFTTTLVGSFRGPRSQEDRTIITRTRFNPSRTGGWRIAPGQTSTVVPALTFRYRTGDAAWITAAATAVVGALAAFSLSWFAAGLAVWNGPVLGTAAVATSATSGTVVATSALGTLTIAGAGTTMAGATVIALNAVGTALVGGVTAAGAALGGASLIALGDDISITGNDVVLLTSAFNVSRLRAGATLSNIRGPVNAASLPFNSTTLAR